LKGDYVIIGLKGYEAAAAINLPGKPVDLATQIDAFGLSLEHAEMLIQRRSLCGSECGAFGVFSECKDLPMNGSRLNLFAFQSEKATKKVSRKPAG
jgi:hypothetical protein